MSEDDGKLPRFPEEWGAGQEEGAENTLCSHQAGIRDTGRMCYLTTNGTQMVLGYHEPSPYSAFGLCHWLYGRVLYFEGKCFMFQLI